MEAAVGPRVAGPPVTGVSCKVHSSGLPPGRHLGPHDLPMGPASPLAAQGRYRELTGKTGHACPHSRQEAQSGSRPFVSVVGVLSRLDG